MQMQTLDVAIPSAGPEGTDRFREQVERIAQSETFRHAEALQRLLRYLGEKAALGEAGQLKEYTIGVEGLGRPVSYDPAHDAAVRVQVGRLRLKLAEYYSGEGKEDSALLTLPKGAFRLSIDPAFQVAGSVPIPVRPSEPEAAARSVGRTSSLYYVAGVVLLAWAVIATVRLVLDERRSLRVAPLAPALQELWQPFLSDRPLLIAIGDPLFVEMDSFAFYRVPARTDWRDERNSARIAAIQKAVKSPGIHLSRRYANLAEVNAAFMMGKFLAPYSPHMSLARASELSWTQLAGNNLLFIGGTLEISDRLNGLPTELQLLYVRGGIQVVCPQRGELSFIPETSPPGSFEDGESFALITHAPGPDGQSDVETFTSTSAPAEVGAIQWYSNPERAAFIVSKLKYPGGHIPRYYQLLLRVKYKGGIPTETSWVLHRELKTTNAAAK
jgi:hypothetical protein